MVRLCGGTSKRAFMAAFPSTSKVRTGFKHSCKGDCQVAFGVPPTRLIPKRSAQVGSPSNRQKNATRLLFCLIVVIVNLGAWLWPSQISKANMAI